MSLLYKKNEDLKYEVQINESDEKISMIFSADCGIHGTHEVLDEHRLTAKELLDILQAHEEKQYDIHIVSVCSLPEHNQPCRHECFGICQYNGHCNFKKDK